MQIEAQKPEALAKMLPISPTEQAGGTRVTDPEIAPKRKGRPPKSTGAKAVDTTEGPPKKQRDSKKKEVKADKPKTDRKTKPKKADQPKKKKQTPKKTEKKGGDGNEETAAKAAIRARNSRKSSAYHAAYKKALAAGLEGSEAKEKAQEVLRLFKCFFVLWGFGVF